MAPKKKSTSAASKTKEEAPPAQPKAAEPVAKETQKFAPKPTSPAKPVV